ncbi:DNA-binding transcriptional regulator, LysR family [Chitinophaga terrae (ex Kim and Jung 2007)]|uniref:DNA-binding transcriptional regulator, LysR family n=1 Tax=Chitinophaga terrae (ex Kim and Jung 2007) TaxID=408074 RepID=A0A1H3X636_9BACT|nr:LysR family transcriptional regulator [Chitinophaga terrae (ex Kim and Jung 2007)]GEP89900.1 transcriptional regulator [Chitinophaga terrae (ex Kim and Jung 2007)]SDZ94855.1 DNA-binding transcriptional regulator, LysR family [Chitinophaga terrae (ex Kim and Jung 2007)]
MISNRHLVFMEVAQQKSFSKASQALFISQPAVSVHIKGLEEHYKTKLFERKGLQIELTEAGQLLYNRLLTVLHIQQETEFDISVIHDQQQATGVLNLGASTTAALYILPKVMSAFHREYPLVNITLLNRNSEIVLQALLDKEINIGVTEEKGQLSNITYQSFLKDQIVAVCSKHNPLARKKPYQPKDLLQMPVAIRERGSGTLEAIKQGLQRNKIRLNDLQIKVRLGGTEALKNFLLESNCVGFLSTRSIAKELQHGELTILSFDNLRIERNFYFIQRKGETSELNKRFIKMAKSIYNY